MEWWVTTVIIPILTGVLGWIGSKYRNKQEKESDILKNLREVIEQQREYIERQQATVERVEMKLERIGVKIDAKKTSIAEAYKCEWYRKGNNCVVLDSDNKNEMERIRTACETCGYNKEEQ